MHTAILRRPVLVAGQPASAALNAVFTLVALKLALTALLDVGFGAVANKLVDAALLATILGSLFANPDYYLKRFYPVSLGFRLVLTMVILTELLTKGYWVYALFELLKMYMPLLLAMTLVRLYEQAPLQVMVRIRAMMVLVCVLVVVGIFTLPPEMNRLEQFQPAYFAGLHTSAYTALMSGLVAFYLMRAGLLDQRATVALGLAIFWFVFFGWGVRTSMVAMAAFAMFYLGRQHWGYRAAMAYAVLLALCAWFTAFVAGLVHLPDWDGLVNASSGRVAMWLYKFRILQHSTVLEMLFGQGAGSDFVNSDVWWWGAKDSHNDFLKLVTQNGFLGLFSVCYLLGALIVRFQRYHTLPVFVAYIASSLFSNGIMYRPQAGMMFALALIAAIHAARQGRPVGEAV